MNFLQLVNSLERESGTVFKNQRLGSVINAPGRQEKMVAWVVEAWRLIQTSRSDWRWMRREFEAPLVAATARYDAASLGITDFSHWVPDDDAYTVYDPDQPRADVELCLLPFDRWKARWVRGAHDAQQPREIAFDYDNRLCVGPKPDKAHILTGEYFRVAQTLAADADVPICPSEHHMTIVWRALMLLGDHDEAPAAVSTGKAKYEACLRTLVDSTMEQCTL